VLVALQWHPACRQASSNAAAVRPSVAYRRFGCTLSTGPALTSIRWLGSWRSGNWGGWHAPCLLRPVAKPAAAARVFPAAAGRQHDAFQDGAQQVRLRAVVGGRADLLVVEEGEYRHEAVRCCGCSKASSASIPRSNCQVIQAGALSRLVSAPITVDGVRSWVIRSAASTSAAATRRARRHNAGRNWFVANSPYRVDVSLRIQLERCAILARWIASCGTRRIGSSIRTSGG